MKTCVCCGKETNSELEFTSGYYEVPSGVVCSKRCYYELDRKHDMEEKSWDAWAEAMWR